MILPDTSAWIEAFRETQSSLCQSLVGLLRSDAEIVVAEPGVMEILAGVRSLRDLRAKRRRMLAFPMIREGASLLHGDRDFDVIARHTDLRIHPVDAA